MKMLAYPNAQIVPMAQTFICKLFLQLNTRLFNVRINDRKVVITFVATVLQGKFSQDVLTALIPSELGILVYKDLPSRDTKYELSGIFSILLIFPKSHLYLVYKKVFAELLAEGDNLHTLKYLM